MRPAILDDVDELIEMQLALQRHMLSRNEHMWRIDPAQADRIGDYYRARMIDDHACLLVIVDQQTGQLAATGLGRFCEHDGYIPSKSGEIDDIWVQPEHRRQGLCRQLVGGLLRFFKSHDVEHLILKYACGNKEAEQVWGRYGFAQAVTTATCRLSSLERLL